MMSSLNPYAAPYVPSAYRAVEDFSDEWWALVNSSPWFRDYWLRECFHEEEAEEEDDDLDFLDICDPVLYDADSLFHSYPPQQGGGEEEEEERRLKKGMDLVAFGSEKWRGSRRAAVESRCFEKAPKIVSVKLSPRTIQQPR